MNQPFKRKYELIEKMKHRPFGCGITNLPKGYICAFRDFTFADIKAHESNHSWSIENNRRTKARYFEIPAPAPKYTAIFKPDGQVLYIKQDSLLDLINERLENAEQSLTGNVELVDKSDVKHALLNSDLSSPEKEQTQQKYIEKASENLIEDSSTVEPDKKHGGISTEKQIESVASTHSEDVYEMICNASLSAICPNSTPPLVQLLV